MTTKTSLKRTATKKAVAPVVENLNAVAAAAVEPPVSTTDKKPLQTPEADFLVEEVAPPAAIKKVVERATIISGSIEDLRKFRDNLSRHMDILEMFMIDWDRTGAPRWWGNQNPGADFLTLSFLRAELKAFNAVSLELNARKKNSGLAYKNIEYKGKTEYELRKEKRQHFKNVVPGLFSPAFRSLREISYFHLERVDRDFDYGLNQAWCQFFKELGYILDAFRPALLSAADPLKQDKTQIIKDALNEATGCTDIDDYISEIFEQISEEKQRELAFPTDVCRAPQNNFNNNDRRNSYGGSRR